MSKLMLFVYFCLFFKSMEFKIIYLVLAALTTLFIYLLLKRSHQNKFHLDYIIGHTFLLLVSASIYIGIENHFIETFLFDLINLLHIGSVVFLILHVASIVRGYREKVKWLFFAPLAIYAIIMLINYLGYYFLRYNTIKTDFLLLQIDNPIYFSDKLLSKFLGYSSLLLYLLRICFTEIDASLTIQKKLLYKVWIYSYLFLLFETILISCSYYFNIINPFFDPYVNLLIRFNANLSLLFFFFNPALLYYLPIIKMVRIVNQVENKNTFFLINNFFKNEQIYLEKRLTIGKVSSNIGVSKNKIQQSIHHNTNLNFNDFVNTYRIQDAIERIKKGDLRSMDLKSIATLAGFNSHQTFFRAFKKVKGCTPKAYRKQLDSITENTQFYKSVK
jgi:AraC-like DNA-binding protein